jgi:ribulose 1,5-bisphosphate carboxylase large subunit-like protein
MNALMRKLPLMRTCKEVTALVIAREDRELPLTEQLALHMHMAICKACPTFERQVMTMRNAMKQWRNYGADDDSAS